MVGHYSYSRYFTCVEELDSEKHSSLLHKDVKRFMAQTRGGPCLKHFAAVI